MTWAKWFLLGGLSLAACEDGVDTPIARDAALTTDLAVGAADLADGGADDGLDASDMTDAGAVD